MSAGPEAAAPLEPADERELLRIVRVFAREWLRSHRRPPGAPHRASLLLPSAAWLRLRTAAGHRCALRLEADRPLYSALAELAVELVDRPPPLTPQDLVDAGFDIHALGRPLRLADPAALRPGAFGVLVRSGDRFALRSASGTTGAVEDVLGDVCTEAGLARTAWRDPAVELHAFLGEPFSG